MDDRNDYKIQLYRGANREFFGTMPLMPVLKESLEQLLGRSLLLKSIRIVILQVPEEPLIMEPPIVENLVPAFGYTYVRVYEGDFVIYRHPHRLYDVLTKTLQMKLKDKYPEETWWGFRIDVPTMSPISPLRLNPRLARVSSTTPVKANFEIRSYAPKEKPSFKIRRLPEEEPPIKTLADFGELDSHKTILMPEFEAETSSNAKIDQNSPKDEEDGHNAKFEPITTPQIVEEGGIESPQIVRKALVKIVLSRSLFQDLCHQRTLSRKVEEGGFLIGKVYRDGDENNTYILEVSNALTAQHTGASFLHLTFTGDSFVEVKRTLYQNYSGERLLGWYHTHLFPATPGFGLSSIDDELHFTTFTIPWQIAGLINLDCNLRTLRFYVRQGNKMVLCPYWIKRI